MQQFCQSQLTPFLSFKRRQHFFWTSLNSRSKVEIGFIVCTWLESPRYVLFRLENSWKPIMLPMCFSVNFFAIRKVCCDRLPPSKWLFFFFYKETTLFWVLSKREISRVSLTQRAFWKGGSIFAPFFPWLALIDQIFWANFP